MKLLSQLVNASFLPTAGYSKNSGQHTSSDGVTIEASVGLVTSLAADYQAEAPRGSYILPGSLLLPVSESKPGLTSTTKCSSEMEYHTRGHGRLPQVFKGKQVYSAYNFIF